MESNEKVFEILVVGLDQVLLDLLNPMIAPLKAKYLSTSGEVENFLENFQLAPGTSVFVSSHIEGMNHLEIGQALGSYFQGLHLIFITLDRTKYEVDKLKKNGFTENIILPLDRKTLENCVEDIKIKKAGGGVKKYKAVKLVDVQPGQNLPFEVRTYMPLNKKYALLTSTGKLSDKKFEMLKQKSINSVFIDTNQVDKFYEFAAEQLINLGQSSNDSVSQTEKAERLQSNVRQLFKTILDSSNPSGDFEAGRDLMDQSKKIVESYVDKKTGLDLKQKLKTLVGEGGDSYSHAQVVSTVACLLSMATGIGQPEDLAIAGLFHDIGIEGLSGDVSIFDYQKLSEEEKKKYMAHPRSSLNLLKEKRVTVTPIIAEIIEKHHERLDGKGFPGQLPAHKIPMEAQLLAYADAFEYLTRSVPGRAALQPEEVHKIIVEKLGVSPDLLLRVQKFLVDI